MEYEKITSPFEKNALTELRAGDKVLLSGVIYTARDAAHKRLCESVNCGRPLPFDIKGQTIFYVGACFRGGEVISAGPTTAMRMDAYAPTLIEAGYAASIGKGNRSREVYEAIKKNRAVYFAAIGGAGAVYADCIKSAELVAYKELGTEAIYKFTVENMPLIVAIDSLGNGIYQ